MANADYFLKIDGIPGESTDSKHKDEIDLVSWGWSETQGGAHAYGGGGGAGKVQMQDFRFSMTINKASPKLFLACAQGKHIKEALLTCRKAGGKQEEYLKIKFADLLVSSYETGGSGTGAGTGVVPTDSIALNFSKIEFTYAPQKKEGGLDAAITHKYDLKANEGE